MSFAAVLLMGMGYSSSTNAQCGFASGLGCSNTDYANFGMNSNGDATTIEYDNYVSGFHNTIVRSYDGNFIIWGEKSGQDGTTNLTSPTTIRPGVGQFSSMTGIPLKMTSGGNRENTTQLFMLTSDNRLWVWSGTTGTVVSTTNASSVSLSVLNAGIGSTNGLPNGVSATDVKQLVATASSIALLTCDGDVYVLTQTAEMAGRGLSSVNTVWNKVQINLSTDLSDIIALRVAPNAFFALDKDGNLWTWGNRTYLGSSGSGNGQAARDYATEMTLPTPASGAEIKMIGITGTVSNLVNGNATISTYYVLYDNGELFSMGDGVNGVLGNWDTSASTSWVKPTYGSSSGTPMNDIHWISPSDRDGGYAFINVITKDSVLYNWGMESGSHLGRGISSNTTGFGSVDPGTPSSLSGKKILAVESGGHTTMVTALCENQFGYVGHKIRGSMADGNGNGTEQNFTFSTASVHSCGSFAVPLIEVIGHPLVDGDKYCTDQTLILHGIPSGGTFSLNNPSDTSYVTLSGNTLKYIGSTLKTIGINYTPPSGSSMLMCSSLPSPSKLFEFENNCTIFKVKGTVWNDKDGDANLDTDEYGTNGAAGSFSGLWANLVDPISGEVYASVPVNADGTYEIPTTDAGTYDVVITNAQIGEGTTIPSSAETLPTGWNYTGNNKGGSTPCLSTGATLCTTTPNVITSVTINSTTPVVDKIDFGIRGTYAVSGSVFHDPDGLNDATPAVNGSKIYNPESEQLYVSLLDDNGKVVSYVAVDASGNYSIDVPVNQNAVLQVTSTKPVIGEANPTPTLPNGWDFVGEDFGTNNTNINGGTAITGVNDATATSGSNGPGTKYDGKIYVNFDGSNDPITGIDFGIQQKPTADPKEFEIQNTDFGSAPAGYPSVIGYKNTIPMNSNALVTSGSTVPDGSLSGSDPEDCAISGSCNGQGGTGSTVATFTVESIQSNTKLYYDFGGTIGVQEVTAGTTIPNFDASKMLIYGKEGEGKIGSSELGFTYSITDKAGSKSAPVNYSIGVPTPLPVKLISFEVVKDGSIAHLNWATATESNNKGFELERSNNGRDWKVLGFVATQAENGNSSRKLTYNFNDMQPVNGQNMYRLKQVDMNGHYEYSRVRVVAFDAITEINVYPNPTQDKLNINGLNGNATLKVYDYAGRLVMEQQVNNANAEVSMGNLQNGLYLLQVTDANGNSHSFRISKIK